MEITRTMLENLLDNYVNSYKTMLEIEETTGKSEDELLEDAGYMYHKGYCDAAVKWLHAIGVSENCNYVMDKLH